MANGLKSLGVLNLQPLILRKRGVKRKILKMGGKMAISPELLEILVCPKCKQDLQLTEKKDGLICRPCRLIYEIRDDIPIMLIDEAQSLDDA